jgi:hypothetical protein
MEFDFDAAELLQVNKDGIAIIDAEDPPSYFRSGSVGFGRTQHTVSGGVFNKASNQASAP